MFGRVNYLNVLLIEQEKVELIKFYTLTASPRKRLLYLYRYYDKIFSSQNQQIKKSYLPEFIEEYLKCLHHYEPIGINPSFTENIFSQINLLLKEVSLNQFSYQLTEEKKKLEIRYEQLQIVLNGGIIAGAKKDELYFPLIEGTINNDDYTFGLLETFSVKINEDKNKTKFHIVPSGKEIEKKIGGQIEISWSAAAKLVKKYIPEIRPNHLVFVQFDHHYGEYVGDSLGAALTLAFMAELHRFYNSKIQIRYNGKIAITGALDNELNISPVSEKNIIKKTEIVFYSDADTFVVNEKEKTTAQNHLEVLRKEYPNRKLKIIGVEDFLDLLDRRSILEVHKQKLIVRTAIYAKKNWAYLFLILLFFSAFGYMYIKDFDDNPYSLEPSGVNVLVKNKSGKLLWSKQIFQEKTNSMSYFGKQVERIIDINDDNTNEVIIIDQLVNSSTLGRINCYNNTGELLWDFDFKDSIYTNYEGFKGKFSIKMIDTDYINGRKILYLFAQHWLYFPSPIFRLDALTGKRLPGTYWNNGGLAAGMLLDIDNDGKKELIMAGLNQEWETAILFAMNKDSLYGRGPGIYKYVYPGKKLYNYKKYLSIPKIDYTSYYKLRYPAPLREGLGLSGNFISIDLRIAPHRQDITLTYFFDYDLKIKDVIIADEFRVPRDSLIAQGKLSLPYTDTPEYKEILKKQIRYWNGKKFVTAKQYFNNN